MVESIFFFGFMALILMMPLPRAPGEPPRDWRVNFSFAIMLMILISGPFISAVIDSHFNNEMTGISLIKYAWIAMALSLPVSIVVAKAFGPETYISFKEYNEFLGKISWRRQCIIYAWATFLAFSFGLLVMVV